MVMHIKDKTGRFAERPHFTEDELDAECEQIIISVPIFADPDGYSDRECPSHECLFQFKIHEDDWVGKVRNEKVYCPFCGHTADSSQWWTQDQLNHVEEAALAQFQQRLGYAIRRDANNWNRSQKRDSFLRVTMKAENRPQHVLLPLAAAAPMRLKITCPACSCRYAVIGVAFFCPACGHNAADLMFTQAVNGIRNVLDSLPQVRSAIVDEDTAETTTLLLVENGLQNAVTAFQRYAESLYARFPFAGPPRRNAFQNLKEGSALWFGVSGKHYTAYLTDIETVSITRLFQQRHPLAHTQGIVDLDYTTLTGDPTYQVGQRIVIRESAVRQCLSLLQKLTAGMAFDAQS